MTMRIASVAVAFVAAFIATACEKDLPVSAADKDVVLRAADLVPYGYGLEKTERYESFKRIRYFDGSHELTYEFETPDSEEDNALYLNVTVSVEKSVSDARTSHGAGIVGLNIGLKANGIEKREIKDFYSYGDDSQFFILEKDRHPIGNVFAVREGKRVFLLILSGMYFEDAATFKELIEGRLKKFSAYTPT